MRERLTVTIDGEVLRDFRDMCRGRDVNMSRRIERYIRRDLKNRGGERR